MYFILANVVVGRTLILRLERLSDHHAQQLQQAKTAAEEGCADITVIRQQSTIVEDLIGLSEKDKPTFNLAKGEKPPAGVSVSCCRRCCCCCCCCCFYWLVL